LQTGKKKSDKENDKEMFFHLKLDLAPHSGL